MLTKFNTSAETPHQIPLKFAENSSLSFAQKDTQLGAEEEDGADWYTHVHTQTSREDLRAIFCCSCFHNLHPMFLLIARSHIRQT